MGRPRRAPTGSQLDAAIQTAIQAIHRAKSLNERLAQADGHVLLAQLLESAGRHERADLEFGRALRLITREDQRHQLAQAHASYAEMLEARGDQVRATQQWRKAARLALQK
jgi:tetratricopeptide (TPR) repeat protein